MAGLQEQVDDSVARLRRAQTDLQRIEAKAATGGLPRTVIESVSAFANGDGGMLLLGLDEASSFAAVEVDAAKLAADLASACSDQLEPPVRPEVDIVMVDGLPVVVALIDELPVARKPCFVRTRGIERGSFLRTHDGDRALTTYEVHVLLSARGQPHDDAMVVAGATVADLDDDLVSALLRRLRGTRGAVFANANDEQVGEFQRSVHGPGMIAGAVDHHRPLERPQCQARRCRCPNARRSLAP
jgi:ATP-dependent DNA helicase RecG